MRALGVVDAGEGVQQGLEAGEGVGLVRLGAGRRTSSTAASGRSAGIWARAADAVPASPPTAMSGSASSRPRTLGGRSRGRLGQTRRSALPPDRRAHCCSPGLTPDHRVGIQSAGHGTTAPYTLPR